MKQQQFLVVAISVAGIYLAGCLMQNQAQNEMQPLNTSMVLEAASNSMSPTIRQWDGVIVDKSVPFSSLKIGDIIVFHTYYPNAITNQSETIVSRVFNLTDSYNGTQRLIATKGDTNPGPIQNLDHPIFQQNYIGKVVSVIPSLRSYLK
jgi:signal peptidase I